MNPPTAFAALIAACSLAAQAVPVLPTIARPGSTAAADDPSVAPTVLSPFEIVADTRGITR